jgi:uncharacterized membrane protein YeaQ/YmgE (transglycosylase-associated protein family)
MCNFLFRVLLSVPKLNFPVINYTAPPVRCGDGDWRTCRSFPWLWTARQAIGCCRFLPSPSRLAIHSRHTQSDIINLYSLYWVAGWLADWLTDWLIDWLTGWLADCLAGWLTGWLVDWLIDRPAGWVTDWQAGWLAGWLTDWLASCKGPHVACWYATVRMRPRGISPSLDRFLDQYNAVHIFTSFCPWPTHNSPRIPEYKYCSSYLKSVIYSFINLATKLRNDIVDWWILMFPIWN